MSIKKKTRDPSISDLQAASVERDEWPVINSRHYQKYGFGQSNFNPKGVAIVLVGMGFFFIALTGSLITWQKFGAQAKVSQLHNLIDVGTLNRRLADLDAAHRQLNSEIEGIVGPGGVLSRVVSQLHKNRSVDAEHTAAIQRLSESSVQVHGSGPNNNQTLPIQFENGGPVQVTPVSSHITDEPQEVIVTSVPRAPKDAEEQGQ